MPAGLCQQLASLVFAVAIAAVTGSGPALRSDWPCQSHTHFADKHLKTLVDRNCGLVGKASAAFKKAIAEGRHHIDSQAEAWMNRSKSAEDDCVHAGYLLWPNATRDMIVNASLLALNAWGETMMGGAECCSLLVPPFCVDQRPSVAIAAGITPFVLLLVLLCMSVLGAARLGRGKTDGHRSLPSEESSFPSTLVQTHGLPSEESQDMTSRPSVASIIGVEALDAKLREQFKTSSIRVLPHSCAVRDCTVSLFSHLGVAYGFQVDNVRSQFEHLLSLLRSQSAMVADRAVQKEEKVDESILLGTAIGDLHAELLGSFIAWRRRLYACSGAGVEERGLSQMPLLAGISWVHLSPAVVDSTPPEAPDGAPADSGGRLTVQLAEIAMFLLVWGEAGNVRFMPEVLYFITECALVADSVGYSGGLPPENKSGAFLSKIIRPIYNVAFEEWYSSVTGKRDKKDVKTLRPELVAYLPADVANYDDWNELFCEPERLIKRLVLPENRELFTLPHKDRFAALPQLAWKFSLVADATKTHREVHSLWGVFASIHRVLLLHAVLFSVALCIITGNPPESVDGSLLLLGRAAGVRFSAVGLIVPAHAMLWWHARWQITGPELRTMSPVKLAQRWWAQFKEPNREEHPTIGQRVLFALCHPPEVVLLFPFATYCIIRRMDDGSLELDQTMWRLVIVHLAVSCFGLHHLLFVPSSQFMAWKLTRVRWRDRVVRYSFWLVVLTIKFVLGMSILAAVYEIMLKLEKSMPGHQSFESLGDVYLTTNWYSDVFLWAFMWGVTFILFLADTQLWFTLCCTILGAIIVVKQRKWNCGKFYFEDAVAKIPARFSEKVLPYTRCAKAQKASKEAFSFVFPAIWDRIVQYMRYEDYVHSYYMSKLVFETKNACDGVLWEDLTRPLQKPSGDCVKVRSPDIFRRKILAERALKTYCCWKDMTVPENAAIEWRLAALARGLALPMPKPYRAPYIPGITVLIPHYGEQILVKKDELYKKDSGTMIPLIHWLKQKYEGEFLNFTTRVNARGIDWQQAGDVWALYTDDQWDRISSWAAMRLQTLWRTVAGLCYYHPALQCHYEAQADMDSSLAQEGVWDPSECFTCMVSMQMFKFFDPFQKEHTRRMFKKFPSCFKVAYIDVSDKGDHAHSDGVHRHQERRYYSCLINRDTCEDDKEPLFRVELPGYPILGDGKGDNQNHAIPFMRGHFSQGIDANQGAYFEQMMMLPNALGEFRTNKRGDGLSKRIIGLPEHITSDLGSIGDFAASAEIAFGTILQRTYAVLGARMHYGHPDIMNKLFMMQQGGVSKATKTINLSEDIFAGMDFTLRGEGRQIKHCEYFHLAKGRDMGFNAVLGFFSKLSSGTGEQVLTRQMFRVSNVLPLPEALSFYYAHAGYYINQFFVSSSLPFLMCLWLLLLAGDCEDTFQAFQHCSASRLPAAEVMATFLNVCYSRLMLLFLVANTMPLFVELWMERSLRAAFEKVFVSMLSLSPLMFVFQAKTIGFYITNEFRFGGASYVATGRGLPTERLPLIRATDKGHSGLLLDYINIAFYDGAMLLCTCIMVMVAGGLDVSSDALRWMWLSVWLVITSWLYAPFIFNPYNFKHKRFLEDLGSLRSFFFSNRGKCWDAWYDETFMMKCTGLKLAVNDIGFFFSVLFLAAWYFTLNLKAEAVITIYSEYSGYADAIRGNHTAILLPPMFSSLMYCVVVVIIECLSGCATASHEGLTVISERSKKRKKDQDAAARHKARRRLGQAAQTQTVDEEAPEAVEEPSEAAGPEKKWEGLPLAMSALVVVVLDIVESVGLLYPFFTWVTWKKAFLAGLFLKWGLLNMCVFQCENMMPTCPCTLSLPIYLWVRAHRMARDMIVSLIVVLPQLPLVFLVFLNEHLCPGCSLHQLLIYRDPGCVERQEQYYQVNAEAGKVTVVTVPQADTSRVETV